MARRSELDAAGFWLERDAGVPVAMRPVFRFRGLEQGDRRLLAEVLTDLEGLDSESSEAHAVGVMNRLTELLRGWLVGWENQLDESGEPLAFDRADFDSVAGPAEVCELGMKLAAVAKMEHRHDGEPA